MKLRPVFEAVSQARSPEELLAEIVRYAHEEGFGTVSAITVYDHPAGPSEFIFIDNTPQAYFQHYSAIENHRRDPVVQHCKISSRPIIWDQSTYVKNGQGGLWEEQAPFGYRTGISTALHLPEGRHFMFGIDRDQALPQSAAALTRLVADLQLFTTCAYEAAKHVLLPPRAKLKASDLTARELETLTKLEHAVVEQLLTGATNKEIARRLQMSPFTVREYVQRIARKLGCRNRVAVVAAWANRAGALS